MSIVINIKTGNKIGLHEVIGKLFDEGYQPCVEETEPTLFYLPEISTRFIEYGEDEDGYYARQVGMACEEDYKAFISTIKIIQQLTNGRVFDEDDEEIQPEVVFTAEWIKQTMKSDFNSVKALMQSDNKIKLEIVGPVRGYFFGMNVLKQLADYSANEEEQHQYVYQLIRKSQYGLPKADYPDILQLNKTDESGKPKTLLVLTNSTDILVGGNLDYFIINMDDHKDVQSMIIFKREDVSKIAPAEWVLFDDRQYYAPKISKQHWNEFIERALAYRVPMNAM